jgi:FKBP-type peptidyl-prolyl cis-trans isomerase FkpA
MLNMRLRTLGIPFLLSVVGLVGAISCGAKSPTDPSQNLNVPFAQTDVVVGTGRQAANGNILTVNYTGWLYNPSAAENKGTQFDTSIGRGPFTFTVGGNVIAGWNQGVIGMAVGGKRRLIIPPSLAYGSAGNASIPPNATLVFDIDLLSIQ